MKLNLDPEWPNFGGSMKNPLERIVPSRYAFEPLDWTDRRLISELQSDARLKIAELGRRVGLSAPTVADRMRRLEEDGVLSYRAEVNPRALGYSICAIVRVSPGSRDIHVIPR